MKMVYLKFPVTPVTAVTEYGVVVLASTGSVDTDPLVREVSPAGSVSAVERSRFQRSPLETRTPETPGGDAVDP